MGNLFEELKRRKVFRVAAIYAVVAWVLIQVADTIAPLMNLPESAPRLVLFLLIILFPIALFLAWAYEVAPEGVKSDSGVLVPSHALVPQSHRLTYATFILVLLVAGFQVADRFLLSNPAQENPATTAIAPTRAGSVMRATLELDQPLIRRSRTGIASDLALTPDGANLIFATYAQAGLGQLLSRDLATQQTRVLGERYYSPYVSPDGSRLLMGEGVLGSDNILVMPVQGGLSRTIPVEGFSGYAAGWLSDEEILHVASDRTIHRKSLLSGSDIQLPGFEPSSSFLPIDPYALPEGKGFVYVNYREDGVFQRAANTQVKVYDLTTDTVKTLIDGGYLPRYVPTGHIVFLRAGALWAAPFDLETLEITGSISKVIEGVDSQPAFPWGSYAFSASGRLVYLPGGEFLPNSSGFNWTDRSGNKEDISIPPGIYADPELSPDGRALAITSIQKDDSSDIWLYDFARQTLSRRTFVGNARNPIWTKDGTKLAYTVVGQGIWRVNADGAGQPEQLTTETDARPDTFTATGDDLFYLTGVVGGAKINRLSYRDSSWISTPIIDNDFQNWGTRISPDGRWLAYISDETGQTEVFVRPYPDIENGKWQISTQGGREVKWNPNGYELFYLQNNGTLMAVPIETDDGFVPGVPQALFDQVFINNNDPPSYSVANDGQRFIQFHINQDSSDQPELIKLMVVENWFEELKRLAPPDPQ